MYTCLTYITSLGMSHFSASGKCVDGFCTRGLSLKLRSCLPKMLLQGNYHPFCTRCSSGETVSAESSLLDIGKSAPHLPDLSVPF